MTVTLDILRIFQIAILILGIIVIYYSQKGYRKTKSRSLLFLALGFVFVTIGAALAGLLFEFLNYDLAIVETIEAGAEVIGFSLIVYSIVGAKD
ncbi:MAG TPA: hypothetical protein VN739_01825 [Nitrososphaerales archaeon]|nr:hypothetical protein [Nitrososphaerales archaeon]